MGAAADSSVVRREIANALGRLYAEEPRLAARFEMGSYARFAKALLAALDLYCRDKGIAWRPRDMDGRRVLALP